MGGKPMLIVLASPHLDNPGRDYINIEVDDVLQPHRQAEIFRLVCALAQFQPTKIAVEEPPNEEDTLNANYQAYLRGSFELGRSEVHQIGFRLAKELGHQRIYAVNWLEDLPVYADTDFESFANTYGQQYLIDEALRLGYQQAEVVKELLTKESLADLYIWINRPEVLREMHRPYFIIARIGAGERYPGAEWVQYWYGRNLKIFVNLTRITEEGDRILLVIGAGHGWLLRQFAEESGLYRLEDPLVYLQCVSRKDDNT